MPDSAARLTWIMGIAPIVICASCALPPLEAHYSVRPADPTAGAFYDAISQYLKYPKAAVVAKHEGVVTLGVRVLRTGEIESVKIQKSSGHITLDNEALAAAQQVIASGARIPWPKTPPPGDVDHFILEFPIGFSRDTLPGPPPRRTQN